MQDPLPGKPPPFSTSRRHDFSLKPGGMVLPELLQMNQLDTIAIGKIYDIFAGVGFDAPHTTQNNAEEWR